MPRRAPRSASFAVKREVVDDEGIESKAASSPPLVTDNATAPIGRPTKALRSGSAAVAAAAAVSAAPAVPASASAAAAASASAPSLSPRLTSHFFASSSSRPTRGRKRKVEDSGSGDGVASSATSSTHGAVAAVKNAGGQRQVEEGLEEVSSDSLPDLLTAEVFNVMAAAPAASIAATATYAGRIHRRSSRFKAVKKEELSEAPESRESSAPPAGAADVGRGTGSVKEEKPLRPGRKSLRRRVVVAADDGGDVEQDIEGTPKKTNCVLRGGADETKGSPVSPRVARKAALIAQVMEKLYPSPPIPIDHVDSFTLLCGVLLSAQTTDAQVNLVTRELFKVAPDPHSLSKMAHGDVQQIIRSVGLAPTKAKHLIALSQQLLDRFGGQVPQSFEELQTLPGVGRKTAAVVMVQAFGTPAFPVDTHIHRLALRWGLTKNDKNASKVEEDLMAIFPRESWAKLHLQFIYFGREHCQARVHDSSACPICSWIKKTGPSAPKTLSELTCLRDYLASPTPPKKSSKNAVVYSERMLEIEQLKIKLEDS